MSMKSSSDKLTSSMQGMFHLADKHTADHLTDVLHKNQRQRPILRRKAFQGAIDAPGHVLHGAVTHERRRGERQHERRTAHFRIAFAQSLSNRRFRAISHRRLPIHLGDEDAQITNGKS